MDTEKGILYRNNKRLEYVSLVEKLLKNEVFVKDMENGMKDRYLRKTCAFLGRAKMNRFKEDGPFLKWNPTGFGTGPTGIDYDPRTK